MIDPKYMIIEVSDRYFRIDWEDIASPNIFSAIDPDKPPIKNIIEPASFGLLFITDFRFIIIFPNIDTMVCEQVYKHCEYYLKKGNRINVKKNCQIIEVEPNSFNIVF